MRMAFFRQRAIPAATDDGRVDRPLNALAALAAVVAVAMIGLEIVATVRGYSAVPYYDMWPAYLGFFRRQSAGEWGAWWELANEHRIVLSRILFWLDLKAFAGSSIFLLTVNFVLASAIAATLWTALARFSRASTGEPAVAVLGFVIVSWCFLAAQYGNFTWAYQSQFFLAQLLPLSALFCNATADDDRSGRRRFATACFLGVASAGTMANGLLALPLLTLQSVMDRRDWRRSAVLAVLAVIVGVAYLTDYRSPVHHGDPLEQISHRTSSVALFLLLYLGNPWFQLLGHRFVDEPFAAVAGLVFCGLALLVLFAWLRNRDGRVRLALLLFSTFVVISGIATASGRLSFGVDTAFTSRYTTPVLAAWAALGICFSPKILEWFRTRRSIAIFCTLLLLALMLRLQWHSRDLYVADPATRNLVGLSEMLDAPDHEVVERSAYPFVDVVRAESVWAAEAGVSFAAMPPFRDAASMLGRRIASDGAPPCEAKLERTVALGKGARFMRIEGHARNPLARHAPDVVYILADDRRVAGVAIGGFEPGTLWAGGGGSRADGFAGYATADLPTRVVVRLQDPVCETTVVVGAR